MSTLLSTPILATLDGRPVRVYGIGPDGRILIAHADGRTDVTNWTRLVVPAIESRVEPAPVVAPAPPPAPWGEWTSVGSSFVRYRNHGTEAQAVRPDPLYAGLWSWAWYFDGRGHGGDGFDSADDALAACEAYTASREGATPTTPGEPR